MKVFDSLASGKPLVLPNFKCLHKIFKNFRGIELFKPGNIADLVEKILKILRFHNKYLKESISNENKVKQYSYQMNAKKLVKQVIKKFNL